MGYSIDARELVLKYRDNGHTLEETHKRELFMSWNAKKSHIKKTVTMKTGKRFKRRNVIAGLWGKRVLAQCRYNWKTDSIWFAEWFEFCLIPCLLVKSVIVLDNASFHNKTVLETIAEAYGHKILWLPKYSPDKNPIENLWENMKKWLRSFSQKYDTIQKAIYEYFRSRILADNS